MDKIKNIKQDSFDMPTAKSGGFWSHVQLFWTEAEQLSPQPWAGLQRHHTWTPFVILDSDILTHYRVALQTTAIQDRYVNQGSRMYFSAVLVN